MHDLIASVVEGAVQDLRAGLKVYWPNVGRNEMAEAHAIGAVGRAFDRLGFHVFHQVACRTEGAAGLVDLVAISRRRSACIALEGKRLYEGNGAKSMLLDWQRLGVTRLASDRSPVLKRHYRMLLATSWQPNIRDWWFGTRDVPSRRRHLSWGELRAATAGLLKGSLIQSTKAGDQWLLYAFGQRSTPFFSTHTV